MFYFGCATFTILFTRPDKIHPYFFTVKWLAYRDEAVTYRTPVTALSQFTTFYQSTTCITFAEYAEEEKTKIKKRGSSGIPQLNVQRITPL